MRELCLWFAQAALFGLNVLLFVFVWGIILILVLLLCRWLWSKIHGALTDVN